MSRRLVPVFVLTLLVAGCVGPADPEKYRLSGSFNDWNEEIESDFRATVSPYTADVLMADSFPPQFSAENLSEEDCAALRAALEEKSYLASLGTCRPATATTNGDEPTGTSAAA